MVAKQPILPPGYKKLEYIESDGRQWINTGVPITLQTKIEIIAKVSNLQKAWFILARGIGSEYNYVHIQGSVNSGRYVLQIKSSYYRFAEYDTQKHYFGLDLPSKKIVFDNSSYEIPDSLFNEFTKSDAPTSIFNYSLNDRITPGLIYAYKSYENGVVTRDMIPAKKLDGNFAGMYDFISKSLFVSASGTAFIAGPEVN